MCNEPRPTLAEEARRPERTVPEPEYQKVLELLKEKTAKNKRLNEENNNLAIWLKMAELERDCLSKGRVDNSGWGDRVRAGEWAN